MDYKNISPIESLWEDYVHLKRVFGITICKPQSPKNIYPFHLSPIISKLLHIHKKIHDDHISHKKPQEIPQNSQILTFFRLDQSYLNV